MKPHYKLVDGKPTRVGMLLGKKVMLVPVAPDPTLSQRHCSQCVFFETCEAVSPGAGLKALGASCIDAVNLVYKPA